MKFGDLFIGDEFYCAGILYRKLGLSLAVNVSTGVEAIFPGSGQVSNRLATVPQSSLASKVAKTEQDFHTNPLDKQIGGSHYKSLKIQPIEYITANGMGFIEGNIVKYITRHHAKNGADDIKKVIHYCELLLSTKYGDKS